MANDISTTTQVTTNNTKEDSTKVAPTLLTIPPELRLLIYEAYFSGMHLDRFKPQPALIHTCKLIRKESLSAYEARIVASKAEHHTKYERKDADLQHLIDTCTDPSEMVQLQLRQMDEAIRDSEIATNHHFELANVQRMRCEEWIGPHRPKRKLSISYMRGVKVPK